MSLNLKIAQDVRSDLQRYDDPQIWFERHSV